MGWSRPWQRWQSPLVAVSIPERVWGGLERSPSGVQESTAYTVSIPERVWGGLEHGKGRAHRCNRGVSIPERVWGGLEPLAWSEAMAEAVFQSLRGFGVGWSAIILASSGSSGFVSIPERVWGGLEQRASESLTVFGFRGTNARTLQV